MAPRKPTSEKSRRIIPFSSSLYNAVKDREDNTVGKKLAQIRRKKGYTLDTFAELLARYGVNIKRAGINKWENGDTVPHVYHLIAVCKALDLDEGLSFFMGDTAAMSPLNDVGMQKLAEYKEDLIASGRYKPAATLQEDGPEYITMPISTLSASAGTGQFLCEEDFTEEAVPKNFVPYGAEFGIHVCGDSMEPVYHDGQIVWVQRCESLEPGEVGIFLYDGDGYIKVYGEQEPDASEKEYFTDSYGHVRMQPVLISYNKNYPPKTVSPHTRFQIAGRVL